MSALKFAPGNCGTDCACPGPTCESCPGMTWPYPGSTIKFGWTNGTLGSGTHTLDLAEPDQICQFFANFTLPGFGAQNVLVSFFTTLDLTVADVCFMSKTPTSEECTSFVFTFAVPASCPDFIAAGYTQFRIFKV